MTATILRRAIPPLAALAAFLAASRNLLLAILDGPGGRTAENVVGVYNHAVLGLNYMENGFIRRGLAGTIMRLFDARAGYDAAAALWLLSLVWLLIPATFLLSQLARRPGRAYIWFAILLALSPQLFLGWAKDVGRTDPLVAGFAAWTAVAVLAHRYRLAILPIVVGSLAHESAVFYGAALLSGVWFLDWVRGDARVRDGLLITGLLGAALVAVVVAQRAFGDGVGAGAQTILAHNPLGGSAAYFTLGGVRTIWNSYCQGFARPAAWLYLVSIFIILPLYVPALLVRRGLSIAILAIAAMLPMAAMAVLAIDYGRWLMMAVMNAWLVAVILHLRGVEGARVAPLTYAAAAGALLVLLALRPGSIYYASGFTRTLAVRIWGETEELPLLFDECDPDWRSAVGLRRLAS